MALGVDCRSGNITKVDYCKVTGELYSVTVPYADYVRWEKGMLIQDAMPYLSADDREFLISGISPKGWVSAYMHALSSAPPHALMHDISFIKSVADT